MFAYAIQRFALISSDCVISKTYFLMIRFDHADILEDIYI